MDSTPRPTETLLDYLARLEAGTTKAPTPAARRTEKDLWALFAAALDSTKETT